MKNKGKGLGRGIDALFQDIEEVDVKKEEVLDLPLNELRPNPYQPRKTFDEQSLTFWRVSTDYCPSFTD